MDPLLLKAITIANRAHAGQVDKIGDPYIGHPARVAARVADLQYGVEHEIVAWLHDVVEDTLVGLADVEIVFGPTVAAAVDALTRRPGEQTWVYYERVRANAIARVVKVADIDDNLDPDRTRYLDPETRGRLATKYASAKNYLLGGE